MVAYPFFNPVKESPIERFGRGPEKPRPLPIERYMEMYPYLFMLLAGRQILQRIG